MSTPVCLQFSTLKKFPFLYSIFTPYPVMSGFCKGVGLGVSDGRPYDGVVEVIEHGKDGTGNRTLIREDGIIYKDLSRPDVERFYLGTLNKPPSTFIPLRVAREFIAGTLDSNALSKKAQAEYCRSYPCGETPDEDPLFHISRGYYPMAESLLLRRIDRSKHDVNAWNNLALLYVTAKDYRFWNPKEAIKLAKKAVEMARSRCKQDLNGMSFKSVFGMDPEMLSAGPYNYTLSLAYYANGDFARALAAIREVEGVWESACLALKELIMKDYFKRSIESDNPFFSLWLNPLTSESTFP